MRKIISLLLIVCLLTSALPINVMGQRANPSSKKPFPQYQFPSKEELDRQYKNSTISVSETTRHVPSERALAIKNLEFKDAVTRMSNLKNINVTPGKLEASEISEAYRYFTSVGKSKRSSSAAHGKIISEYYHILRDYEYLKADATGREVWTAPGRGHKDMYITVKNADGSVKMAVTFNALNKGFLKAFAKSFEKVTDRETALHYSEQVYKIMLKTDGVDYDTNHVLAAYFKKGLELKWVCDEVSGMEIREDWAIARNKKDRLCPNAVTSMLALGYLGQGEQNVYEFLNHNYMGRNAHAVLKGGANALMLMDSEASYEALKKVIKNSVKKATPTNVFKIALNAFFDLIWVTSYVERGYKYFKGVYNNEVTIRFEYPDVKHIKKFGLPSTAGKCTPFSSTRDCVMMPTRNVWEDIGSELILFGGARGKKLVSELVSEEPNLHKPFTIGAAIYSDYNQKLYYAYKAGSAYADMPEGTRRRIELELGRGSAINENHIGMVTEYRKAMSGARGFDQIMGGVYMVALVVSLPSFMEFVASIPQWARGSRIGRYFSASRGAQAGKAAPSEAIGSNLKPQVEVNKQIGLDLIKEYNEAFGLKTPRNPGTTPGTNIYTPPNTKVPVFNSGRPGGARPQVGGGNVDVLTKPRPQPQTSGPILNTLTNEVKTLYKPRPQVSEVEVITQPQVQPITNILETLTQNYVKAEEALSTLNKGKGANVISDITGTPAQLPAQTPNITKGFSYITTLAGTLFNNKTEVITQPQTKTVKTEAIPQPAQVNMLERIITNTTDSAAHPSAIMQNPGEETPKMPETERVDHGRLERELNNAKNGYISQYLMNNFFSLTQEQQKELDKILTETAKRPKTDLHQINPVQPAISQAQIEELVASVITEINAAINAERGVMLSELFPGIGLFMDMIKRQGLVNDREASIVVTFLNTAVQTADIDYQDYFGMEAFENLQTSGNALQDPNYLNFLEHNIKVSASLNILLLGKKPKQILELFLEKLRDGSLNLENKSDAALQWNSAAEIENNSLWLPKSNYQQRLEALLAPVKFSKAKVFYSDEVNRAKFYRAEQIKDLIDKLYVFGFNKFGNHWEILNRMLAETIEGMPLPDTYYAAISPVIRELMFLAKEPRHFYSPEFKARWDAALKKALKDNFYRDINPQKLNVAPEYFTRMFDFYSDKEQLLYFETLLNTVYSKKDHPFKLRYEPKLNSKGEYGVNILKVNKQRIQEAGTHPAQTFLHEFTHYMQDSFLLKLDPSSRAYNIFFSYHRAGKQGWGEYYQSSVRPQREKELFYHNTPIEKDANIIAGIVFKSWQTPLNTKNISKELFIIPPAQREAAIIQSELANLTANMNNLIADKNAIENMPRETRLKSLKELIENKSNLSIQAVNLEYYLPKNSKAINEFNKAKEKVEAVISGVMVKVPEDNLSYINEHHINVYMPAAAAANDVKEEYDLWGLNAKQPKDPFEQLLNIVLPLTRSMSAAETVAVKKMLAQAYQNAEAVYQKRYYKSAQKLKNENRFNDKKFITVLAGFLKQLKKEKNVVLKPEIVENVVDQVLRKPPFGALPEIQTPIKTRLTPPAVEPARTTQPYIELYSYLRQMLEEYGQHAALPSKRDVQEKDRIIDTFITLMQNGAGKNIPQMSGILLEKTTIKRANIKLADLNKELARVTFVKTPAIVLADATTGYDPKTNTVTLAKPAYTHHEYITDYIFQTALDYSAALDNFYLKKSGIYNVADYPQITPAHYWQNRTDADVYQIMNTIFAQAPHEQRQFLAALTELLKTGFIIKEFKPITGGARPWLYLLRVPTTQKIDLQEYFNRYVQAASLKTGYNAPLVSFNPEAGYSGKTNKLLIREPDLSASNRDLFANLAEDLLKALSDFKAANYTILKAAAAQPEVKNIMPALNAQPARIILPTVRFEDKKLKELLGDFIEHSVLRYANTNKTPQALKNSAFSPLLEVFAKTADDNGVLTAKVKDAAYTALPLAAQEYVYDNGAPAVRAVADGTALYDPSFQKHFTVQIENVMQSKKGDGQNITSAVNMLLSDINSAQTPPVQHSLDKKTFNDIVAAEIEKHLPKEDSPKLFADPLGVGMLVDFASKIMKKLTFVQLTAAKKMLQNAYDAALNEYKQTVEPIIENEADLFNKPQFLHILLKHVTEFKGRSNPVIKKSIVYDLFDSVLKEIKSKLAHHNIAQQTLKQAEAKPNFSLSPYIGLFENVRLMLKDEAAKNSPLSDKQLKEKNMILDTMADLFEHGEAGQVSPLYFILADWRKFPAELDLPRSNKLLSDLRNKASERLKGLNIPRPVFTGNPTGFDPAANTILLPALQDFSHEGITDYIFQTVYDYAVALDNYYTQTPGYYNVGEIRYINPRSYWRNKYDNDIYQYLSAFVKEARNVQTAHGQAAALEAVLQYTKTGFSAEPGLGIEAAPLINAFRGKGKTSFEINDYLNRYIKAAELKLGQPLPAIEKGAAAGYNARENKIAVRGFTANNDNMSIYLNLAYDLATGLWEYYSGKEERPMIPGFLDYLSFKPEKSSGKIKEAIEEEYVDPTTMKEVVRVIKNGRETSSLPQKPMLFVTEEMAAKKRYDDALINQKLDAAAQEAINAAEEARKVFASQYPDKRVYYVKGFLNEDKKLGERLNSVVKAASREAAREYVILYGDAGAAQITDGTALNDIAFKILITEKIDQVIQRRTSYSNMVKEAGEWLKSAIETTTFDVTPEQQTSAAPAVQADDSAPQDAVKLYGPAPVLYEDAAQQRLFTELYYKFFDMEQLEVAGKTEQASAKKAEIKEMFNSLPLPRAYHAFADDFLEQFYKSVIKKYPRKNGLPDNIHSIKPRPYNHKAPEEDFIILSRLMEIFPKLSIDDKQRFLLYHINKTANTYLEQFEEKGVTLVVPQINDIRLPHESKMTENMHGFSHINMPFPPNAGIEEILHEFIYGYAFSLQRQFFDTYFRDYELDVVFEEYPFEAYSKELADKFLEKFRAKTSTFDNLSSALQPYESPLPTPRPQWAELKNPFDILGMENITLAQINKYVTGQYTPGGSVWLKPFPSLKILESGMPSLETSLAESLYTNRHYQNLFQKALETSQYLFKVLTTPNPSELLLNGIYRSLRETMRYLPLPDKYYELKDAKTAPYLDLLDNPQYFKQEAFLDKWYDVLTNPIKMGLMSNNFSFDAKKLTISAQEFIAKFNTFTYPEQTLYMQTFINMFAGKNVTVMYDFKMNGRATGDPIRRMILINPNNFTGENIPAQIFAAAFHEYGHILQHELLPKADPGMQSYNLFFYNNYRGTKTEGEWWDYFTNSKTPQREKDIFYLKMPKELDARQTQKEVFDRLKDIKPYGQQQVNLPWFTELKKTLMPQAEENFWINPPKAKFVELLDNWLPEVEEKYKLPGLYAQPENTVIFGLVEKMYHFLLDRHGMRTKAPTLYNAVNRLMAEVREHLPMPDKYIEQRDMVLEQVFYIMETPSLFKNEDFVKGWNLNLQKERNFFPKKANIKLDKLAVSPESFFSNIKKYTKAEQALYMQTMLNSILADNHVRVIYSNKTNDMGGYMDNEISLNYALLKNNTIELIKTLLHEYTHFLQDNILAEMDETHSLVTIFMHDFRGAREGWDKYSDDPAMPQREKELFYYNMPIEIDADQVEVKTGEIIKGWNLTKNRKPLNIDSLLKSADVKGTKPPKQSAILTPTSVKRRNNFKIVQYIHAHL
ncbi:hypothetical protein AAIR98_001188 [Elusimicrobium simillimum]|uniref:hypothetical protein n=1 Tax=Elusimicrobium simillimum TaxID=3143438 RepID=UPI003C7027CE